MSSNFENALLAWGKAHHPADIKWPDDVTVRFFYDEPYEYSEYTAGGGNFVIYFKDGADHQVWSRYVSESDYTEFFNELLAY